MNPRRFLATAKLLIDTSVEEGEEADWRSAISRAYYGAFLEARELLAVMGFSIPRSKAHGDVWSHYKASAFQEELNYPVGRRLEDLRILRNDADYDMTIEFRYGDAEHAVAMAWQVVDKLDECRSNARAYENIKRSIEVWRTRRP